MLLHHASHEKKNQHDESLHSNSKCRLITTEAHVDIPFEPTRSFCYRFSRYQALPEVLASSEAVSGGPFRLIDVSKRIIDEHLTPEQQGMMVRRAESEREDPIHRVVKTYIPFIAKNTGQLISLGDGMFRLPTADDISEEELEDAALEDESADAPASEGHLYAFSFPSLTKTDGAFPIKIGMTAGDVATRVQQQCRGSATFDNPVILGQWLVKRVRAVELAVHNTLRARGKWRENIPGAEWFDTTVAEIECVVAFITNSSLSARPGSSNELV